MLGFCPLASGSKGNCLFLGSEQTKILIDAGLSAAQIVKKLAQIQVGIEEIDAVLITHEHSDHIKGVETLAAKYKIPLFANSETAISVQSAFKKKLRFKIFTTGETFTFGDMEIHPFSVQHDAADPVAFSICVSGLKIGICTDLGFVTSLVIKKLEKCDYLYIESNHQVSMVYASSRPAVYKERVLSRQGHLSNQECAELLDRVFHSELKGIYLAHLSEECNTREVALQVVGELLAKKGKAVPLRIALQEEISEPVLFSKSDFEPIVGHTDLGLDFAVF